MDFRLYVSSPDENKIYAFDDVGATMDTFDTYGPAIGVAFDHFTSDYTITPTAPSFVYSVNYSGYAEFYRQYISSATPEYMYTSPGKFFFHLFLSFFWSFYNDSHCNAV